MASELVARDREFAEVHALVRRGSGAVISGEAGVGKSVIASAVAAAIAAEGDVVERAVATVAARAIPFGALGALLPDDLTNIHPTLVLGAVVRRLRDLPGRRTPLVVVDDAHLLDESSAATVLGLATSGAARLLLTLRTGEHAPDAVRALWKDGLVQRVDVAPFDRAATRRFLEAELGGDVAATTAELLWQRTEGNALFLTELVRHARRNGELRDEGHVWVWSGHDAVPERLADLLDQRFDGLSPEGRDGLGALVLGEPLSIDTLVAVSSDDAVAEIEAHGLVVSSEHGATVLYRFAHPLLAATAERRLTASRRRHIARSLLEVRSGVGDGDLVRRATWHVDAGIDADSDLLVGGARAVLLTNPLLARRLAERALAGDDGPGAALTLADAHAELGDIDAARSACDLAAGRVRDGGDRLAVLLNRVGLTTFSERRPDRALELLATARPGLAPDAAADLDSCAALLTAFSARPAETLALADAVLATDPPRAASLRARSARVAALALVDRPVESVDEADALVADVDAGPAGTYAQGVAHVMAMLAHLARSDPSWSLSTDPQAGHWPMPPSDADIDRRLDSVAFPLFDGARRLFEGHYASAVPALREALAQQHVGEGLLRSEAIACLTVALAGAGRGDEAAAVLAHGEPDGLAVYPGLAPWARGAVAASLGRPDAVTHALEAAAAAQRVGAVVSTVAYLGDAARYGAVHLAAERLDAVGHAFRSPYTIARAQGIRARADGSAKTLLEAADAHVECGLVRPALALAESAGLARAPAALRARAQALALELRRQLDVADVADRAVVAPAALTRRELEVGRLAASGLSDRDIAGTLVVSVRTVESHLAAAYRKLGIASRRELRDVLGVDG